MSFTTYAPAAAAHRPGSGIPPVAWVVTGLVGMGVVRAAEGVVHMGREVLGVGPYGPDGSAGTAARAHSESAMREVAGMFLIAASLYGVHFIHRATAEVRNLARDISR